MHLRTTRSAGSIRSRAKETARRNYETSLKQNGYWLGRLQFIHMNGQDPALLIHRTDRINVLTIPMLQETFNKYFPMDRYTVVTLMPAPASK